MSKLGVTNYTMTETEAIVARTVEILGGTERFREVTDTEFHDMERRWNQDTESIGRILRAHLYVEHYLTEHIEKANPRLGSVRDARLSFSQKLELLDSKHPARASLKSGIAHLNKIRNRLAHNLNAQVTKADSDVFLRSSLFGSMTVATNGLTAESPPLEVMERFAQFAANSLTSEFSTFGEAFSRALEEAKAKR